MGFIATGLDRYDRGTYVMSTWLEWLPPLLARLTVGWIMLRAGWNHLDGLPGYIDFFRSLGIPAPELQAPFAAWTELVCGALLMAGLFTRLAALPLLAIMVAAILTALRPDIGSPGDLLALDEAVYVAALSWLAVRGGGALALDRLLLLLRRRTGDGGGVRSPLSADAG